MGWFILFVLLSIVAGAIWYFEVFAVIMATLAVFLGAIFTFGTLPFWIFLSLVSLFVAWCVSIEDSDSDKGIWSGTAIVTVSLFGIFVGFANKNFFHYEGLGLGAFGLIVLIFVAHLASGVVFSVARYYRFGRNRMKKLEAWKRERLSQLSTRYHLKTESEIAEAIRAGEPLPPDRHMSQEVVNNVLKAAEGYREAVNYKATYKAMLESSSYDNNIHRIMVWIGLWPWSLLAWVVRDPVRFAADSMSAVYDRIYRNIFGDMQTQFNSVFSPPEGE